MHFRVFFLTLRLTSFLFACEYLISFKDCLSSSFQVVLFIAGVVERASKELSRRFTSFTSRSRKVSKHEKLEEHSLLTVSNIWNNTSSKTNKNTHKIHACFPALFAETHRLLAFLLFCWKLKRFKSPASKMLTPEWNQNNQQTTVRKVLFMIWHFLSVVCCIVLTADQKGAFTLLIASLRVSRFVLFLFLVRSWLKTNECFLPGSTLFTFH